MSIPKLDINRRKPPKIDENFFTDVILRNSTLGAAEASSLSSAIITEMRSALGRRGGRTTKARYGPEHYSRIGKMGGRPPMKQAHEIKK